MLNRETLPVWMLADAVIGISAVGGLGVVLLLSPLLAAVTSSDAAQMQNQVQRLRDELGQRKSENEDYRRKAEIDAGRIAGLERYQREAREWIADAQRQMKTMLQRVDSEKRLNQQLLNLRGDLSRTLFVIDVSGSMGHTANVTLDRPNWGSDGKPWTYVKNQVGAWLAHLPVDSFRVLCFSDSIVEFPADARWSAGEEGHAAARRFLAGMEPDGYTFTEAALKRAFERQPTTIIFFTDGAPTDADGNLDESHQARILSLIADQNPRIPINVVAVNNYFEPTLGSFLHSVAGSSGGGFVGL